MSSKRRRFTPEFRAEAVRLVTETDRPLAHVAAEIGVGAQLLGRCVQQSKPAAEAEDRALDIDARARARAASKKRRRSPLGSVVPEDGQRVAGGQGEGITEGPAEAGLGTVRKDVAADVDECDVIGARSTDLAEQLLSQSRHSVLWVK